MHPEPQVPESYGLIDLKVREEKLKLLFHQSFPGLFISLVNAALFCWASWDLADQDILLGWLALIAIAALVRLLMFVSYFRAKPHETNVMRWERPYVVSLLATALLWGGGLLLTMAVSQSPLHQAFTMVILIGMAGGAISTYTAYPMLVLGAVLAVLFPSTLWLYFQPTTLQLVMAIGSTLFILGTLRGTKVISAALDRSLRLTHELRIAHEAAEQMAKVDALTGVNNRRAFFERGEQIASYCQRHAVPLCALLIDIDHFKEINDSHGHSTGDTALRKMGDMLHHTFRRSDVCGRLGGEEFAVLLPDTPLDEAQAVAEKLRAAIAATQIEFTGRPIPLSVSIGVANGAYEIETLLQHADAAMYRAKAAGRNQVMSHAAEDSPPSPAAGVA